MEKQSGKSIKALRTDRGGGFYLKTLVNFAMRMVFARSSQHHIYTLE